MNRTHSREVCGFAPIVCDIDRASVGVAERGRWFWGLCRGRSGRRPRAGCERQCRAGPPATVVSIIEPSGRQRPWAAPLMAHVWMSQAVRCAGLMWRGLAKPWISGWRMERRSPWTWPGPEARWRGRMEDLQFHGRCPPGRY